MVLLDHNGPLEPRKRPYAPPNHGGQIMATYGAAMDQYYRQRAAGIIPAIRGLERLLEVIAHEQDRCGNGYAELSNSVLAKLTDYTPSWVKKMKAYAVKHGLLKLYRRKKAHQLENQTSRMQLTFRTSEFLKKARAKVWETREQAMTKWRSHVTAKLEEYRRAAKRRAANKQLAATAQSHDGLITSILQTLQGSGLEETHIEEIKNILLLGRIPNTTKVMFEGTEYSLTTLAYMLSRKYRQ